jgi:hypothetical protein
MGDLACEESPPPKPNPSQPINNKRSDYSSYSLYPTFRFFPKLSICFDCTLINAYSAW